MALSSSPRLPDAGLQGMRVRGFWPCEVLKCALLMERTLGGKESIENRIKKVFVNICYLFLVLVVTFKCDLQSNENHQQ